MTQSELELQLKVWKELAISKQILMRSATDALKLDPDCSQDDLKAALDVALKKAAASDANVVTAREQAKASIATMERKLATSEKALAAAQATIAEQRAAQDNMTQQMAGERAGTNKELQRLKDTVAEKDKALKAINMALNDTPESVVKKLKAVKKEKQDEADARRQVEASFTTTRKKNQDLEKQVKDLTDNVGKLLTQHRDLHALGLKLHQQLTAAKPDAKELPAVPDLDDTLIESLEQKDAKSRK